MCLFYMICHVYLLVDLLVYMHFYAQTQYPYIIFLMCACLEGWFTCYQQFGVSKGPAQRLQETTGHSALPLRLLGSENSVKPRKPKSQRCLGDEKWSAWRFSSHVILPCFLGLRAYGFRKQINSGMTFEFPTIILALLSLTTMIFQSRSIHGDFFVFQGIQSQCQR